jgi:hypothetical protein
MAERPGYYRVIARRRPACRCTPMNRPCPYCERGIEAAEAVRADPDPERVEDGLRAAERCYERWLDEIGGSR